MPEFVDLPADIKACIVDWLISKDDLLSLARTCKEWYHPPVAKSYKYLGLALTLERHLVAQMLSPENIGLKYVKECSIKAQRAANEAGQPCRRLDELIEDFVEVLPPNQLEKFK